MKFDAAISTTTLAPCGMNCAVCYVHLREKKACQGCWGQEDSQPQHCRKCNIRDCAVSRGIDFCFECLLFPCAIIKRLDKSYRQRYHVSLIENAIQSKTIGTETFLIKEKQKWTCVHCGGVISLHDRACSACGREMEDTV
jgi:Protein of unknown function (DUF3795)